MYGHTVEPIVFINEPVFRRFILSRTVWSEGDGGCWDTQLMDHSPDNKYRTSVAGPPAPPADKKVKVTCFYFILISNLVLEKIGVKG